MPTIVNPIDAMKTFEPALKRGELQVQRGIIDPTLLVHFDRPNNEMRWTYAKMRGDSVAALAIIVPADPLAGKPVFQIGYAVPQHLRKRGLAKAVASGAIAEFQAGLARNGLRHFFIEAVVGRKNIASQKVAMHFIGGEPREVKDEHSGEEAYLYMKEIITDISF